MDSSVKTGLDGAYAEHVAFVLFALVELPSVFLDTTLFELGLLHGCLQPGGVSGSRKMNGLPDILATVKEYLD
jgi:hypothetical protein